VAEMNAKFAVPAGQCGHAFVPVRGHDLEQIFSVQTERTVGNDNTVAIGERVWQLERTRWRGTLAGCRVTICEHLDGQVSIVYGPHVVGRYTSQGMPLEGAPGWTEGGRRGGQAGGIGYVPAGGRRQIGRRSPLALPCASP